MERSPTEHILTEAKSFALVPCPMALSHNFLVLFVILFYCGVHGDEMFWGKPRSGGAVLPRSVAPAFTANAVVDEEFQQLSLSDYKGKWVVLLFYPFDFTFVCPTEVGVGLRADCSPFLGHSFSRQYWIATEDCI